MTDPHSPDWLDGYRTAEAEYERGHGHKDDLIRESEARAEAAERQVETIAMANAANLVKLARVREARDELAPVAKLPDHVASNPKSRIRATYEMLCGILDGEDE